MTETTEATVEQKAIIPCESPIVQKEGGNITCTALVPEEMQTSQSALIEWSRNKVTAMRAEADELREAYQHAKDRKWSTATLKKHWTLAVKRVSFYEKMQAALEHGFVIIPNFPISIFAIKTEKEIPAGQIVLGKWETPDRFLEHASDASPVGAGEYQNPFPSSFVIDRHTNEKGSTQITHVADDWRDINFPITMAKPEIMRATDRAMALKIFDQFGILPAQTRSKGDPLIVAQLIDPRDRLVTFMVAWHLDTRTL